MSRKKIFDLVFSVIFIGVLVTFTLYFSLTLLLRPEHNLTKDYFGGNEAERSFFSSFDDALFKNAYFHESIVEVEYKLFGRVSGSQVIKGEEGFLFMGGVNGLGYDYVADYTGNLSLGTGDLDRIYQYIKMRSRAYENRGIDYYFAVIPNSQTVYSEYMPSLYGEQSNNTLLLRLGRYLENKEFDGFVDLTDVLRKSKKEGLLYNNTENSVNALGAYYVYAGLMDAISDDLSEEISVTERERYQLYTHYTDGRTAAELAGIEHIVSNETISMSNATEYTYTTVEIFEDLETTYTKSGYRDKLPLKPSVLLEMTGEWDKIRLKPYFSNTFGMASYRVSHQYSASALENSNPSIVIQLLHEDELLSVIEPSISLSYDAGLEPGQHPYKTTAPRSVKYVLTDENTVCITGEVESGAEVSVFGDEITAFSVDELGGRFITTVGFDDGAAGKEIFVCAKAEGKLISDPVSIIGSYEDLSTDAPGGVLVGRNSMIYKDTLPLISLPTAERSRELSERSAASLKRIRTLTGKETSVICSIIPEKLTVYSAGAPDSLAEGISDMETMRSLFRMAVEAGGLETADASERLRERVSEGKLFAQTSDVMSDLGQYYVYLDLAERIKRDHPAVVEPMSIGSFGRVKYRIGSGVHSAALGFDSYKVIEKMDGFVVNTVAEFFRSDGRAYVTDKTEEFYTRNYIDSLPTAIIVRDGAETKMIEMLSMHFETMYVLAEGDRYIPESIISSVKPDYVIYLCRESAISQITAG